MLLITAWRPEAHSRVGTSQLITAFPPWAANTLAVMAPEHLHLTENETGVRRRQVRLLRLGKHLLIHISTEQLSD